MRIDPMNAASVFGPERAMTGVSAALAEARRVWQVNAPGVGWDAVHTEAARVRAQQPLTLLEALYEVYRRFTTGEWDPRSSLPELAPRVGTYA
jgi:hypothetical protein